MLEKAGKLFSKIQDYFSNVTYSKFFLQKRFPSYIYEFTFSSSLQNSLNECKATFYKINILRKNASQP